MAAYLLTYTDYLQKLRILRFDDRAAATAWAGETPNDVTAIVVEKPEDLDDVATKVLVAVHNVMCAIADGAVPSPRAVQKFQDRTTATRRTFDAMEKSAETPDENSARHSKAAKALAPAKEPKAAKAPKAAKVPKAPKPPREPKVRAPKPGKVADDAKITVLAKENPKREGSAAHGRFALYRSGMLVKTYLEKGGTASSLSWDVEHGFIEVK